jgi:hypothetical protein
MLFWGDCLNKLCKGFTRVEGGPGVVASSCNGYNGKKDDDETATTTSTRREPLFIATTLDGG